MAFSGLFGYSLYLRDRNTQVITDTPSSQWTDLWELLQPQEVLHLPVCGPQGRGGTWHLNLAGL